MPMDTGYGDTTAPVEYVVEVSRCRDFDQTPECAYHAMAHSGPTCLSNIAWTDSHNNGCSEYDKHPGWCPSASLWANMTGKDATAECCVCGGGSGFNVHLTKDVLVVSPEVYNIRVTATNVLGVVGAPNAIEQPFNMGITALTALQIGHEVKVSWQHDVLYQNNLIFVVTVTPGNGMSSRSYIFG